MKRENRIFEITPKVVLANSDATIKVKPLDGCCKLNDDREYEVKYYPLEHFSRIGEYKYQEPIKLKPVDGILYIKQYFKGEQEHVLEIGELGENEKNKVVKFHIYSVEKDLFDRKPYKGDLHMHSYRSDGIESPAFVAASCRKVGFDFMALTDHRKYTPSIEAQEAYKSLDLDLLMCRGEEIHPPKNPVHMINFGGNFSVNELIQSQSEKYFKEVNDIEKTINNISDADTRYQCASCIWCFDKIREGKGMGIFCHPYWLINEGYYISDTVTSFMYEHQPYDANEVIGGYYKFEENSNTLQIARYNEERAKGRKIPIVGVSDAHGCEDSDLFGWFYTIAFSSDNEQENIISSIKNLYSVAVEAIPGETIRAYGPFRLVKYALFLFREVFPYHDEMCFEEGQLMTRYIAGDNEAGQRVSKLKGQTSKLYKMFWGK